MLNIGIMPDKNGKIDYPANPRISTADESHLAFQLDANVISGDPLAAWHLHDIPSVGNKYVWT
jgi:hypothetical protein